jgi:hypothetical protein
MKRCAVALGLIGAICSSACARGSADGWKLTQLVRFSRVTQARAGILPPRIAGGEFGIISAARMSPDGRWIAVVDETPPYVKIVDSNAVVSGVVLSDSVIGGMHSGPPVVAASNRALLVARPWLRRIDFYDMHGRRRAGGFRADFLPITATAVSDSVWLVYGPSDRRTSSGEAEWIHCVYDAGDSVTWKSILAGGVDSVATAYANVSAPLVDGEDVIVEHRQSRYSGIVSINCRTASSGPTVRDVAAGSLPAFVSRSQTEAHGIPAYEPISGIAGAGFVRFGASLWAIATDQETALTFECVIMCRQSARVTIAGSGRLMDSRRGRGLLFADDEHVPMLFVVQEAAVGGILRAPDHYAGGRSAR